MNPQIYRRFRDRISTQLVLRMSHLSRRFLSSDGIDDTGWQNDAESIFQTGLRSVQPQQLIDASQNFRVTGNILKAGSQQYELNKNVHIAGFGKAALGFVNCAAKAMDEHLVEGVVVCPKPVAENVSVESKLLTSLSPALSSRICVFHGPNNNMPDSVCVQASRRIADLAGRLSSDDLLLAVITGGGSALLTLPEEGVNLDDVKEVTKLLSRAGCDINGLNTVRKRLDQLKGGGLAMQAMPAKVLSLIISDIVDDPLENIASGPTVHSQQSADDALAVLQKYGLMDKIPGHVMDVLSRTNLPTSPPVEQVNNVVLGNNKVALSSAASHAAQVGYQPLVLTHRVSGDAKVTAELLVAVIDKCLRLMRSEMNEEDDRELDGFLDELNGGNGEDLGARMRKTVTGCRKVCLLAGGETTVKVHEALGFGGRAAHTCLEAALSLHQSRERAEKVVFLIGSTDGLDGPTELAGAWVSPQTIYQATEAGLDYKQALSNCDAYGFFKSLKGGVNIRPGGLTGTNVMDLFVITLERE